MTEWIHPRGIVMFSSHVEEQWEMQSCLNVWTKHTGSPGLWQFQWILTTLLFEGIFKFHFLTSACSVISAREILSWPSHLDITISVYILFVGQSWTFKEDAAVFFLGFFCSYCRSGSDIWLDRTEILHGGVWKAPCRTFFCLPAANTK